jgi:hypothetical protein
MIDKLINIWIKERAQLSIYIPLVALLAWTWALSDARFTFLESVEIAPALIGKAVLSLLLILFALAASLFILLRRPNIKDYDIINPPGFYKHKKTGAYYCQPCIDQRHIASPLSIISEEEFLCRACKETYRIDYSVLICNAYLSMVHDRAADEFIHKKERGS